MVQRCRSAVSERDPFTFRVVDLKQYAYCPRILYYQTVLQRIRPTTYKMEAGISAQGRAEGREKRRSLRAYGLVSGRRRFNVAVQDPSLHLSGEIDMLIETDEERIPVDYKNTKRVGPHFKLQLAAYGRLLEEGVASELPEVRRGFLYLIPARRAVEIRFTKRLRNKVARAMETMREIATSQRMPVATKRRSRCVDCEFRRFCNDVI